MIVLGFIHKMNLSRMCREEFNLSLEVKCFSGGANERGACSSSSVGVSWLWRKRER